MKVHCLRTNEIDEYWFKFLSGNFEHRFPERSIITENDILSFNQDGDFIDVYLYVESIDTLRFLCKLQPKERDIKTVRRRVTDAVNEKFAEYMI